MLRPCDGVHPAYGGVDTPYRAAHPAHAGGDPAHAGAHIAPTGVWTAVWVNQRTVI